jgi:2-isopropylmalate synthase
VIVERDRAGTPRTEATIRVRVDGQEEHTAAEGDGPVNALDLALRKALEKFYPPLREVHLSDYKVRVINPEQGTGAKVRVLVTSRDRRSSWSTLGVSENLLEASWEALSDSVMFKLLRDRVKHSAAGGHKENGKE